MRAIYAVFFVILLLFSCAKVTEEERAKRAQEHYKEGMAKFKEEDYGDAAWEFNEALKYMDYLTPKQVERARFYLAKSYYLDEEYVDAIIALEDYIFYYPNLRSTEEAFYMLVDSYIKVSPDPYRDQEYTWKAIQKAKEFLARFPHSPYAKKVKDLIEKAYRKIAKHHLLIAKFYEDYGYPYSASLRYKDVLINFADYINEREVVYRYIKNLLNTDKQAKRQKETLSDMIENLQKKLSEAKTEEERKAIKRRINFLRGEIRRWEEIVQRSIKEGREAINKYAEVYGKDKRYEKLLKILREKYGKAEAR